jgi:hypothetical protein
MGQINNGKMLIANFDLNENDIQALKLNDKIRIDNSWWNINKVIDYDANARKLTRVELISIDNEINFTPFMGPSGPIIPTSPPSIGAMQMLAMSGINTTRMITSNVFGNQATAMVMGRGNTIVGGTRSVVVGDGHIVSEDEIVADDLRTTSINGVATSELFPPFVQTNADDLTLWNNGQGGVVSNTTYGESALKSNTTGFGNTALGVSALESNSVGFANTAIGRNALLNNSSNNNTAVGVDALLNNTIGNSNTAVGNSTDSGDFDASIILGAGATATASNQFVTGSVTYPAGAVNVATVTQTQTWDVIINGVAHKILLA